MFGKDLLLKRQEAFSESFFVDETVMFIEQVGTLIGTRNKKIFICGNGGSASQASHFAAELVGRYKENRNHYCAITIGSDYSISSALSNDFGFENSYAFQLENLASEGDVLIVLSTSGNSKNVVKALEKGKMLKMTTCALLGNDGGKAKAYADLYYIDNNYDTAIIQEHHLVLIHLICEYLQKYEVD